MILKVRGLSFDKAVPVVGLLVALLLAFILGVQTTGDLNWPADSDLARDAAQAMTIYDGDLLGDPQYRGELLWYNPLVPATVAALARLTGQPVPVMYVRAGSYLNLLAPVLFAALVALLFDAWTALAATVAFLFVQVAPPTTSALYATYSAWLYAANLAQAGLYGTLLVYVVALRTGRRRWFAATGVVLGVTFLAHTAPAVMAGVIIAGQTLIAALRDRGRRRATVINFAVIVGLALVISAPLVYSLLVHYRLHVLNLTPGDSVHAPVALDNFETYWRGSTLEQPLFGVVMIGLMALAARARRAFSRSTVALWLGGTLVLLGYSYVRQALKRDGVEIPGFLPSHHFLYYLRAVESMALGAGLVAVCSLIGAGLARLVRPRSIRRTLIERGLLIALLIGLVGWAWPAYLEREDFNDMRQESVTFGENGDFVAAQAWVRANTQPADVFLTSDRLATYIVGPAGRKIVAGDSFFANPYVDWKTRATDRDTLFGRLMAGDAQAWPLIEQYAVTYVLAGGNLAKGVEQGALPGVSVVYRGASLMIFRVERP